jgi:YegS/Rv2252/BmrU family lipid kinase
MDTGARSRKVQLILNGKAAGSDALQTAVARQRAAGDSIEVRVTLEKADARRFVAEAGEVDLLIAAGGDGTLNEVVHGLMDLSKVARPVLGVVPLGTANDSAIGCGIPRDPEEALTLCMEGEGVPVDVGKANEHWFLNAASIGFGAEVTASTPPELKRLLGQAAYTMMGAILGTNIQHYQGRLTLPDYEITGTGPMAIVGNGVRRVAVSKSLPVHVSTTICSMSLPFVIFRRAGWSPPRESCKSFHRTASISPIGKLPGPRSAPKKRFRSTWMASRCGFRKFDMKRYREQFG